MARFKFFISRIRGSIIAERLAWRGKKQTLMVGAAFELARNGIEELINSIHKESERRDDHFIE